MSVQPFIGLVIAGALVPIIAGLTSRARRFVRHRMSDGRLRRILLTPLGYSRKARNEAAERAVLDDYHLLVPHQVSERDGASTPALPPQRL
jgi:hypothetical protein